MLYATVRQRKIHVKNPATVVRNGVGVDLLTLDMDAEWRDMTSIVCVFTNGEVSMEVLHTFGEPVLVPWECVAQTGRLAVSCTGYVGEEKVMTTMAPDSFWTVVENGPVTGQTPMEPTATLYEQVVTAAGMAQTAAKEAEQARNQLLQDRENGLFDGVSPTVTIGTVTEGAQAQVTNAGTAQDLRLNFVLPRGGNGRGVQSMCADGGLVTVRYTDGTCQQFALKTGGVGSWEELTDRPILVSNLAYSEETGTMTIVYEGGGIGVLELGTGAGTPVKGVDYWTEADIAEIRSYVDAAILGGAW